MHPYLCNNQEFDLEKRVIKLVMCWIKNCNISSAADEIIIFNMNHRRNLDASQLATSLCVWRQLALNLACDLIWTSDFNYSRGGKKGQLGLVFFLCAQRPTSSSVASEYMGFDFCTNTSTFPLRPHRTNHHKVVLIAQSPWTLSIYQSSLLAGSLDCMRCPHRADACLCWLVSIGMFMRKSP